MQRSLAIITGGTKGIGFGIASELGSKYDLALSYLSDTTTATKAVEELKVLYPGIRVQAFQMDLTNFESIKKTYREIKELFNCTVSILVNNAGKTSQSLVLTETIESYEELIYLNFLGPVYLSKLACADMARANFGRIINISSSAVNSSGKGLSAYSSSKCALEMFSNTLAGEVAKYNITVNIVRPGLIETSMTNKLIKLNSELPDKNKFLDSAGSLTEISSVASTVHFLIDSPQISRASIVVNCGN